MADQEKNVNKIKVILFDIILFSKPEFEARRNLGQICYAIF